MQVRRRAAVLILLGLSFGIPGAHAATARSPHDLKEPWWNLVMGAWAKAGCTINPWGLCVDDAVRQAPNGKEGCGIDPLGRCGFSSVRQAPTTDEGCRIDPLGRCLGH